jgi:ribbon-helix-helix protein
MATVKGKRVLTSLYLDPSVAEELKQLSAMTRVPQAVYLREAVDFMLAHYRQSVGLIAGRTPEPPKPLPVLTRLIKASEIAAAKDKGVVRTRAKPK